MVKHMRRGAQRHSGTSELCLCYTAIPSSSRSQRIRRAHREGLWPSWGCGLSGDHWAYVVSWLAA
jgi:hypothetical protein